MFRLLSFVLATLVISTYSAHSSVFAEPPDATGVAVGKNGTPDAVSDGKAETPQPGARGLRILAPLAAPFVSVRERWQTRGCSPPAATIESQDSLFGMRRWERLLGRLLHGPWRQPASPAESGAGKEEALVWHSRYGEAMGVAEKEGRMLLILFCRPGRCTLDERFEADALSDPAIRKRLADWVKVKLPLDATFRKEGKETVLLKEDAFEEMRGLPGLAIVDLAHKDSPYFGHVVSVFPFLGDRVYTADQMREILDLPQGSLTQRTMVYAVRVHPEHPASTQGELHPVLADEAEQQAAYQARIGVQGHHSWETRFHRINAKLPQGLTATEVCAESWPGQGLLESAIECVRCWRLSSGHWEAVRGGHPVYGYDIKRGTNGIWYATGIFGRQ